jgi:hypothetical protein
LLQVELMRIVYVSLLISMKREIKGKNLLSRIFIVMKEYILII